MASQLLCQTARHPPRVQRLAPSDALDSWQVLVNATVDSLTSNRLRFRQMIARATVGRATARATVGRTTARASVRLRLSYVDAPWHNL